MYNKNNRKLYEGRELAIVKPSGEVVTVTVKAGDIGVMETVTLDLR